MIKFLGQKYYTFEEAIEITSKCVCGGSNARNTFEPEAKKYMRNWETLIVDGVSSFVFAENDCWFKVYSTPSLLVGNTVLDFFSYKRATPTNFYLGGMPAYPIHSNWKYDKEEPKKVLKATAKSLQTWCDYLIAERDALHAYNDEVLRNRETAIPMARRKLINCGFVPYYTYEREQPQYANRFICLRGGVECVADVDADGKIHTMLRVNYNASKHLFADVL